MGQSYLISAIGQPTREHSLDSGSIINSMRSARIMNDFILKSLSFVIIVVAHGT